MKYLLKNDVGSAFVEAENESRKNELIAAGYTVVEEAEPAKKKPEKKSKD